MSRKPRLLWRDRHFALPPVLERAIEQALGSAPAKQWTQAARSVSERYRAERQGDALHLAPDRLQTLGYAAMLMPATYAQLRGAMAATAERIPDWEPTTLLDLGSGPGTALWAATAQWPSLTSLTAIDYEPAFLALGRDLARLSESAAVRSATWEQADLSRHNLSGGPCYDLVVIGHVLNELPSDAQISVVEQAWAITNGLLLIVEPGTVDGFEVVRGARDRLLESGARTIAPCVHNLPCPLLDDWCHFPQRLMRPDFQRRARGAPSQWEDAKFSYAAMARFGPADLPWGRVIREPRVTKGYVDIETSTATGIVRYRAQKRNREVFRLMRHMAWGDVLNSEPAPPITSDSANAPDGSRDAPSDDSPEATAPPRRR